MSMKKSILCRGILGGCVGIALSCLIAIFISLGWGNGAYLFCPPALIEAVGTEAGAAALQALLSALMGAALSAGSLIWEVERWSLMKQTALYLGLSAAAYLPVAYLLHWMEHSLRGMLGYLGSFLVFFAVVWGIQYGLARRKVARLNRHLP